MAQKSLESWSNSLSKNKLRSLTSSLQVEATNTGRFRLSFFAKYDLDINRGFNFIKFSCQACQKAQHVTQLPPILAPPRGTNPSKCCQRTWLCIQGGQNKVWQKFGCILDFLDLVWQATQVAHRPRGSSCRLGSRKRKPQRQWKSFRRGFKAGSCHPWQPGRAGQVHSESDLGGEVPEEEQVARGSPWRRHTWEVCLSPVWKEFEQSICVEAALYDPHGGEAAYLFVLRKRLPREKRAGVSWKNSHWWKALQMQHMWKDMCGCFEYEEAWESSHSGRSFISWNRWE